jgi:uncharacterized protein (TIGR00369 family)
MSVTKAEYLDLWEERHRSGVVPPVQKRMGISLDQLSPTTVLTMALSDDVRGPVEGSVHGGMLATFADVASAVALWNCYEDDSESPVTTDMHVRYYRQPNSGPLKAEATVVHRGRRLLSTECSIADAAGRVLSRSTATYMLVPRTF